MPRRLRFIVLLPWLLVASAHAGAADAKKATTRDRPAGLRLASDGLHCDGARRLRCGDSVDSTNAAASNHASSYPCAAFDESGGEVVFRFELASYSEVTLDLSGLESDLDLFLMAGCSAAACIRASTGVSDERIVVCLPPGTYYASVDGFRGSVSRFRLSLSCRPCTPCSPAVQNDVCSQAEAVPMHRTRFQTGGNTKCATDDYHDTGCTGFSALGNDVAYRLVMPPGCSIQVTLRDGPDGLPLDRSVYLVEDCADPPRTCVAGSDRGVQDVESFTYGTDAGGIFYLIVDSFGNGTSGDFELEIVPTNCSVVAVESRAWARVKRLYR